MHILHISNSYGGTAVYKNLYSQLDELGIQQTIYVPLNYKNRNRVGNHLIDFKTSGSRIIYSTVLQPWHKIFYMAKINIIVDDICKKVDLPSIDLVHASTLCVDGAAAYKLHKRYGIPFINAIRNTDINSYYKIFIWRKDFFTNILNASSKVIFLSPKYKDYFLNTLIPSNIAALIKNKIDIIPNGIEPYFLNNRQTTHKEIGNKIQLIFISSFKKGKGLIETILAIDVLRKKGLDISLRAIGKGLPNRGNDIDYTNKVELLAQNRPWIYLENYQKPPELCEALQNADIFIMPSKPETFGLVYVEALSQNVPIIYTKGEGFDGFYQEGVVGYPAEAGNVSDIAKQIEKTIANHKMISNHISNLDLKLSFDWSLIAQKYKDTYLSLKQ